MRNDYNKKVFETYEKILSEQSDTVLEKCIKSLIREFQKIKRNSGMMQTSEDSGLENLWDEICVQTQYEYSFYWEAYVDYIRSSIEDKVNKMSEHEVLLIWFQTEDFFDLSFDADNEENKVNLIDYNLETVVNHIFNELLSESVNYTNARIEKYIYQ